MKPSTANTPPPPDQQTVRPSGRRTLMLASVLVLLGVALAAVWFKYGKPGAGGLTAGPEVIGLSDHTREQLGRLNAPVEIRFYSVLPPASASESLRDFSGRVDRLLSEFENANSRRIHVIRNIQGAETNAAVAAADGIRPFNLDKGEACFLGVTVAGGGRKESLPQLQAEWGPALEYDLARLIFQVAATPSPAAVREVAPVSPAITNDILRLIPNLQDTSLEDGVRILTEAAAREFAATGEETENQLQAAQRRLGEAQTSGSEAEQQVAMERLQALQLEQRGKYKEIATRLQTQLDVFRQMKAAATGSGGQ